MLAPGSQPPGTIRMRRLRTFPDGGGCASRPRSQMQALPGAPTPPPQGDACYRRIFGNPKRSRRDAPPGADGRERSAASTRWSPPPRRGRPTPTRRGPCEAWWRGRRRSGSRTGAGGRCRETTSATTGRSSKCSPRPAARCARSSCRSTPDRVPLGRGTDARDSNRFPTRKVPVMFLLAPFDFTSGVKLGGVRYAR